MSGVIVSKSANANCRAAAASVRIGRTMERRTSAIIPIRNNVVVAVPNKMRSRPEFANLFELGNLPGLYQNHGLSTGLERSVEDKLAVRNFLAFMGSSIGSSNKVSCRPS